MTPDPAADRRRTAALAGHRGDADTLRAMRGDPNPGVRATVLAALQRCSSLDAADLRAGLADPVAAVRRRAAELAAGRVDVSLLDVLADRDPLVSEMAAWAAGERPDDPQRDEVTERLIALAGSHRDPLVREAAVAALGSLEAEAGRAAVLAALGDKPAIRRRAVLALAAYEGDDILAALREASGDRDWQVREAAEELLRIVDGDLTGTDDAPEVPDPDQP